MKGAGSIVTAWRLRGDLIRWAREQQGLTMKDVHARAGITPGYQSEVERGDKNEVSCNYLSRWLRTLHINELFAHGQIPRYREDPNRVHGLGMDAHPCLKAYLESEEGRRDRATRWVAKALQLVSAHSDRVPRVVLAYVMDLSVDTLDNMMLGQILVNRAQVKILAHLLGLPHDVSLWREALQADQDEDPPFELEAAPEPPPAPRGSGRAGRDSQR
jgi:transcriptional regulator with XRE-family HTH domain